MSNKTLRMKLKASVLAVALAALPLSSNAAGLGKITVLSVLGQPLRAEIDITASREELSSLSARVASADAFKQAGVEFTTALTNIRFSVDKRPDGQPVLSMRSEQPFSEPFLDLLVEMNWASGRLVREYTFLLDPPELMQKPAMQTAPVAPPVVAAPPVKQEVTIAPPSAPLSAPPQPGTLAAPAPVAPPPPANIAPPAPEKKPGAEMKVVRGTDGVQRIVKTEPAPEKAPQEKAPHTVKRGETLNRIATENKPEGVSLDQMLIALFRNNKDAFDGSNMNRLKAGKILSIPDHDTAAAIDKNEARKIILAQSADFNAYRKKLAAATAHATEQKEEAPKQSASGKIEPLVKDKAPPPTSGKDKLEISKSVAASAKSVAAMEEELQSREKALKEANSRIADLDKNINDLKKLVELKNQSMADLQKQAQAAKPAPAPETKPPVPPPAVQPPAKPAEKAAEKPVEKPAEPTPAVKPVEPPAADKQAQPASPVQPPVAPKPAPAVKKPAPPPPPMAEPSFIDDNPELVFGGGGVLALLLGYLGFSTWRKKRQEKLELGPDSTGPASQRDPSINSVFGSTGGQIVDTGSTANSLQTDFSLADVSGSDSEGVDPIAEADVYMAYGRNAQAEEILLDALKTDPTRQAIHLKLLEIYAARKSLKQFETIAIDLQKLTDASGPNWEKAVQMGQQIDPQNNLYSSKLVPEGGFDPAATMVLSSQDLQGIKEGAVTDKERMLSTVIEPAAELAPEPPQEEQEIQPESLDFDLDLTGDTPLATSAASLAEQPAAAAAGEIDFDFDLGEPTPTPSAAAPSSPALPEAASSAAPDKIDFDFDLGGGEATPGMKADTTKDDNALDFDLDLTAPAPSQTVTAAEDLIQLEADTSGKNKDVPLDFDLELDEPAAAKESQPPALSPGRVDLSSISLDLDEGNMLKAAPAPAQAAAMDDTASQEVGTKLELAQAYEEMGDKEGARELLHEVLNEGNEAQQATARSKLEKLD